MPQAEINRLAAGISREIPAEYIGLFLDRFQASALKNSVVTSCGCGCGGGCGPSCGDCHSHGCDGESIDRHGHLGLTEQELNSIGQHQIAELKSAIKAELSDIEVNL